MLQQGFSAKLGRVPVYRYHCEANGQSHEVFHRMSESLSTWGELAEKAKLPLGETPADAPVERILFAAATRTPVGDSRLKEQGFTKLVRRDKGVYENVTATGSEARYMRADDPSSMPHLHKKVGS